MAACPLETRLIENLKAWIPFVDAQTAAGLNRETLMQSQVDAMLATIASTPGVTLAIATAVSTAINVGPWSPAQKVQLAAALGEAHLCVNEKAATARSTQTCTALEQYFTECDWTLFGNTDFSIQAKTQAMASRMAKLGMRCPNEKMLMKAGAILQIAALQTTDLSAQSKRNLCV